MMMKGQFQIVVLEDEDNVHTHSFPGPWGQDLTSSDPQSTVSNADNASVILKILPRVNEREVDPASLRTEHP